MFKNAKRVWMITDIHFGVRANSREWAEIQRAYFFNFFIPLVEREGRDGDVLLVLGDVFDNRQSISIPTQHLALDVFEQLSKRFAGVVVIAGNHDVWGKSSNEMNSLRVLRLLPGVTVYEEPEVVQFGPVRFLLMPWRKDHEAEAECVKEHVGKADYVASHCDVNGAKFNRAVQVTEGVEADGFSGFRRVYTGHIHYAQNVEPNIKLLGCPYQMSRSDMNNKKGVTVLDLATGEETYFENRYSPRFIRLGLNEVLEMTPVQARKVCSNNFVDVALDSEAALKAPLSMLVEMLEGSFRRIDFQVVSRNAELPDVEVETGTGFDFERLMEAYVNEMPYEPDTQKRVLDSLKKLHQMAQQKML
jgi:DNA repair exonuclease SbcCD nuclease subunit